jgi:hypothetical protein
MRLCRTVDEKGQEVLKLIDAARKAIVFQYFQRGF